MKRFKITKEFLLAALDQKIKETVEKIDKGVVIKNFEVAMDTIEKDKTPKIVLLFKEDAHRKIIGIVKQAAPTEVGWHGLTERTVEEIDGVLNITYTVKDILIFPQVVTGGAVDSDPEKYGLWQMNEVGRENMRNMRYHGHSHVNMATNPSSTDTNYQARLMENLQQGYYIFTIENTRGEYWTKIYDADYNLVAEQADIVRKYEDKNELWAKKEFEDKVKKPVVVAQQTAVVRNPDTDYSEYWRNYYGYYGEKKPQEQRESYKGQQIKKNAVDINKTTEKVLYTAVLKEVVNGERPDKIVYKDNLGVERVTILNEAFLRKTLKEFKMIDAEMLNVETKKPGRRTKEKQKELDELTKEAKNVAKKYVEEIAKALPKDILVLKAELEYTEKWQGLCLNEYQKECAIENAGGM